MVKKYYIQKLETSDENNWEKQKETREKLREFFEKEGVQVEQLYFSFGGQHKGYEIYTIDGITAILLYVAPVGDLSYQSTEITLASDIKPVNDLAQRVMKLSDVLKKQEKEK